MIGFPIFRRRSRNWQKAKTARVALATVQGFDRVTERRPEPRDVLALE